MSNSKSLKTTSNMNVANMANSKNPFLHPEITKSQSKIFLKGFSSFSFSKNIDEHDYSQAELNFNQSCREKCIQSNRSTNPFTHNIEPIPIVNHNDDDLFVLPVRKIYSTHLNKDIKSQFFST